MKPVGIGTRVLNFLVDTLIIFLIAYSIGKINDYYAQQFMLHNVPFKYHFSFGYLFFTVLFIYYTICELLFARTPGKWFSFSKVVNAQNNRPNILQVFIRSLVRLTVIDMFFFPFFDKTLHDYLSKTNVVEV